METLGKKTACNFLEVEDDGVNKIWPSSKFEKPALLGGAVNHILNRPLGLIDPPAPDEPSYNLGDLSGHFLGPIDIHDSGQFNVLSRAPGN